MLTFRRRRCHVTAAAAAATAAAAVSSFSIDITPADVIARDVIIHFWCHGTLSDHWSTLPV